ncbi:MAG TPA: fumarylacetoacetate hydrolase family protein [Roseiflexaceae bacterium]|nr:fumarylacetoacetate hydrolase family protein [Roseiflexaceae bacterium]
MRFVSFTQYDPFPRAGVLVGGVVIDLSASAPLVFEDAADARWELIDILRGAPQGMGTDGAAEIAAAVLDQLGMGSADELAESANTDLDTLVGSLTIGGAAMVMPLEEVKLLAPLPRPSSLRDFYAFEQHVATAARNRGRAVPPEWYNIPVFYFSNHTAIYGPDADVPMPRSRALDYELEIACVIGRAGRDILAEDAEEYIAGYLVMNDWSARDLQRDEMSVGLGPAKGKDFATSLGPVLVTPDELEAYALGDGRYNLTMVARVNGQERSRGNFRDIYYTFGQMIARASQDVTLYPGDVIGSGTVGTGCLLELTAGAGPWLEEGDVVELEVEGLGLLRNRVVA